MLKRTSNDVGTKASSTESAPTGHDAIARDGRYLSAKALLVSVILCSSVLPVAYYLMIVRNGGEGWVPSLLWRHVYLNAGANLLVFIVASRSLGRLDKRISAVLSSMLMAHGTLAFVTLTFRLFYSNEVMLVAAANSAILSMGILATRQRLHSNIAAVIGPPDPVVEQLKVANVRIETPGADLRPYDLILTTWIEPPPGWTESLTQAMMAGKPMRHVAEYLEEEQGVVSIDHFHLDHLPLGGLTSYQTRKRVFDLALVALASPLAAILVFIGAISVLISMGRPVFFTQSRVGLGGRPFMIYKLRTMRPVRPGEVHAATAHGDLRVGKVGQVLRKFRIDELPQLLNVLKGEMSIIGPRPEWTVTNEGYLQKLPAYAFRQLVRPGISGWAQVRSGYAVDLEEVRTKLSYDLFYIKNFSFSLDLQILLRTITTVLTGKGAR